MNWKANSIFELSKITSAQMQTCLHLDPCLLISEMEWSTSSDGFVGKYWFLYLSLVGNFPDNIFVTNSCLKFYIERFVFTK